MHQLVWEWNALLAAHEDVFERQGLGAYALPVTGLTTVEALWRHVRGFMMLTKETGVQVPHEIRGKVAKFHLKVGSMTLEKVLTRKVAEWRRASAAQLGPLGADSTSSKQDKLVCDLWPFRRSDTFAGFHSCIYH